VARRCAASGLDRSVGLSKVLGHAIDATSQYLKNQLQPLQKSLTQDFGHSLADRSRVPHEFKSTVLSVEQEAIVVAFRRHTLLPLDDFLYALQPTIPHSDAVIPASLPPALRHQPIAGG
jgi:hypothetical protein